MLMPHKSGMRYQMHHCKCAYSAIQLAKPEDFDWDKIFEGADWFHWSGITPAISDASAKNLELALIAAKKAGATVP